MTQTNDEESLAPIVDALRADRLGEYESLVSAFVKAYSEDTLWPALGKAHGSAFNVFERLSAWPADGVRVAMRRLMPVVAHIQSISEAEGTKYAIEHPQRSSTGDRVSDDRPIMEAARLILRTRDAGFLRSIAELDFDAETGKLVPKLPSGGQ